MDWLPGDFAHPARLDLVTGHHLRPIRADDVDLDLPAVLGSQPRLWSIYGDIWGWPPATLTDDDDRDDLARHEREIAAGESFNYALFDAGETELLGCTYIDPPTSPADLAAGVDAVVSWWVVDGAVGTAVADALDEAIPAWLASSWPFSAVRYGV